MAQLALVVDDSMLIRHTVCRFLEDHGFKVESASNGVEALEMLQGLAPDLIITDLQMPKMDGYQLIEALQSRPETAKIPVIVLAAKRTQADPDAKPCARHVIYKDIDIQDQLERVLEIILPHPPPGAGS